MTPDSNGACVLYSLAELWHDAAFLDFKYPITGLSFEEVSMVTVNYSIPFLCHTIFCSINKGGAAELLAIAADVRKNDPTVTAIPFLVRSELNHCIAGVFNMQTNTVTTIDNAIGGTVKTVPADSFTAYQLAILVSTDRMILTADISTYQYATNP